MSERSRPLLWTLLGCAVVAATLVAAGFVLLAGSLGGQTAALIGTVSECAWSLAVTRTLPLGLLLPGLLGIASIVAFARSVRRYRRERRLLGALPLEPIGDGELGEMSRMTGLAVYRTPASRPAAFCFGLVRPRIVFTSGLVECLSDAEQAAAFWHEAQHARTREPLRCLLARLAASTFFWLPLLRDLFDRYTLVRELDADRFATSRTSSGALAGALHGAVTGPRVAGAVGFADFAAARVDRLLDPGVPLPSLFTSTRLVLSIGAVALLAVAFTYPTNVPVSKHIHSHAMMMKVPVLTSAGVRWTLVPCT